jgi:hypothetical protein
MGQTYNSPEQADEQGSACTFALDIEFSINIPAIPGIPIPSIPLPDIEIELPSVDLTCPFD